MKLTGRVEEAHKLGPPGYGETPEKDAKLTIFQLRLATPVEVCADATADGRQHAVSGVEVLQLKGRMDPENVKRHLGVPVNVYGWLDHKTWASDFTDIVLWVDSIPATRSVPPTVSARS